MLKIILLLHRLRGDEGEDFRRHWREVHAPLLLQLPNCNARCYRLTPTGLKPRVLLVKLRTRLLGPLASLIRQPNLNPAPRPSNSTDAAYRELDIALDHLSAALNLQHAA